MVVFCQEFNPIDFYDYFIALDVVEEYFYVEFLVDY